MGEASNKQATQTRDVRFLHRRWQVLLFALAASLFSLATYWYQQLYHPEFLESMDQRSRDVVFRLRSPPVAPQEVAVIAIDERSIKDYGRWPWSRSLQGELIHQLKQYDVGTLALDIVFAQAYGNEAEGDKQDAVLIDALRATGAPVVGGYFFRPYKSRLSDDAALEQLYDNRVKIKRIADGGHVNDVPHYEYAETNQPHIAEHFEGLGAFNRATDMDGLVRRAPLLLRHGDEVFPSLALRALAVYAGVNEGLVAEPEGVTEVRLANFGIPVDEQGRMTANFYHQNESDRGIAIYSAADVLNGVIGANELAGRLVFVGVTEIGIADLIPTPVNPVFPGVMMHATVAANILQQEYLYRNWDTVLIDIALIALIPLVGVLLLAMFKHLWQMTVISLLIMTGSAALFYWLVAHKSHLVSLMYPSAALLATFIAFGIYYILTSQRTTKFLTDAFGSYVSPDVVDQLLSQPDSLGLSGEQREVTLLFSDIRNFTGMAERLPPPQLVEMLNQFFDSMTQVIHHHKGTLDKYIGDAIMAIFNAPLSLDNHQQRAAQSALDMQQKLTDMRSELETSFGVDLQIGIGVHSGEVVVGNLGSSQRFDYTAVGDAVNIAARTESACKTYKVPIIVTQAIQQHLDNRFLLRPLDKVKIIGKSTPIDIFELMQPNTENRQLAEQFSRMFAYYIKADFKQAEQVLQVIQANHPNDWPTQQYLQRCAAYQQQAPGADWNGVYQVQGNSV